MKYKNFDDMTDDELDALILNIAKEAERQDNEPSVVDPERFREIVEAGKELKALIAGTNAKISFALHEPYKSMGYINIVGRNLTFSGSAHFIKASSLASNVDIFPLADGGVRLDFTFHGLTKKF